MRLPLLRIVLLALSLGAAGLTTHVHRGDAARNTRYAEIASGIAGRPVEVRCPGFWKKLIDTSPNQGTVRVERGRVADTADLSVEICEALDDIVHGEADETLACLPDPDDGCRRKLDALAFGIEALTHEAFHLRGILEEARAECYALQTATRTAVALGIDPTDAAALNVYYVENLYPRLPPEYHSPECRGGGSLDLHPETPAWPDR